jgi:hypothetical protein
MMDREENKNQRRDKKISKGRYGMKVSVAGKKIAEIIANKLRRK